MSGQNIAGDVTRPDVTRWTSLLAVAGAAVQIGYGVLACVFRYPTISDRPFEALWAIANVGMIANIVTWLLIGVARPGPGSSAAGWPSSATLSGSPSRWRSRRARMPASTARS